LLSSVFAMVSLRYVPLGEFAAIVMATPLLTTLIANRFMAEPVSRLRWALVLGGFAGVLLIIRPGGPQFEVTWLLPLIVVVFNTGFQLLTSHLARSERAATTHFLSSWTGAMLASVALPFVWVSVTDPSLWLRMGLMGAMGALGHYCLTVAYTRAPAVTLSPYLYGHIGSTMVLGWLVFDHVPDGWAMVGMAVITLCGAAGAWLSVRERKNNSTSNSTSPPEDIS
jgi:drug/metabolite transporter (DMT)-like permease